MTMTLNRSVSDEVFLKAQRFLALEGYLIDCKDWDAWIELYDVNAEYWVPAWKNESTVTNDPSRELSLIYYPNRAGLEDRVFRIKTKKSLASYPLPRTCHIMNVARVSELENGHIGVECSWIVHTYRLETAHHIFGLSRYELKQSGPDMKIVKRHTVVHNDTIPNVLDIYSI